MKEHQLPEGRLLEDAMKKAGLSARKVATEMGISDTRLRHIVNGYQPIGNGQVINVVGPPETLARAAHTLGVTADQLREAGRSDAAEVLEGSGWVRADASGPRGPAKAPAKAPPHRESHFASDLIHDVVVPLLEQLPAEKRLPLSQRIYRLVLDAAWEEEHGESRSAYMSRLATEEAASVSAPADRPDLQAVANKGGFEGPGEFGNVDDDV